MCYLGDLILLLPPEFRSNGEGTVFTGVCLFTFRGGGVPHLADGAGVPHLGDREYTHPADGGTPSSQ